MLLTLLQSRGDGPPPVVGPPIAAGGGGASRVQGAGPDAQVTLEDYRRRFGGIRRAPGRLTEDDDEDAIAVLLHAIMH